MFSDFGPLLREWRASLRLLRTSNTQAVFTLNTQYPFGDELRRTTLVRLLMCLVHVVCPQSAGQRRAQLLAFVRLDVVYHL